MTVLEARNVEVWSGRAHLLKGVSVALRGAEFLVIAGMNGAGKSTLLRTLAGELTPRSGSVLWKGAEQAPHGFEALARERAYLSQQTVVTLPFRVLQVVLLGTEAAGLAGEEAEALAEHCMALAGVSGLRDRTIDTLSGGEQQRVHWARVLAQLAGRYEGKCLMLDEPVSALDLSHQHEMLALAREVARAGAAVVAVLHDLNLAAQYADRFVFLREGAFVCEGTPEAVLRPEIIEATFEARVRVEQVPGGDGKPRPWVFVDDVKPPPLFR